ncbi:hypothetical protein NUW58_g3372 [Xylaria curta]|uniref:Uncharacterized protein n=1 Tax=Xylaria curta TaxID=42375 RepID=A0ACC1PCU3_9PEZI|nr:hypothetical protein NUW58_g3372 [Xylaria curta]
MPRYAVATSILACLRLVAGHGGGMYYEIDGVVHKGNWNLFNNTDGSIQRSWTWDHNVQELDNRDMACGHDGTPHINSYHAPLQAGNTISVNYSLENSLNDDGTAPWTFGHPYGPMLAYMARCPDEGCETADINSPIWFKIWEAGLLSGNWVDGHWAMRDVYKGANLDIPTPASLKPGKYLLRHEMINLQTGPVQWFPNCIHLEVSGPGNSIPSTEELVAFPGAYNNDVNKSFAIKNGAYWFYVENAKTTVYPMPGPPVWQG